MDQTVQKIQQRQSPVTRSKSLIPTVVVQEQAFLKEEYEDNLVREQAKADELRRNNDQQAKQFVEHERRWRDEIQTESENLEERVQLTLEKADELKTEALRKLNEQEALGKSNADRDLNEHL